MSERAAKFKAQQYVEWLWKRVDGKAIPATTRARASAACLQLTMEHHQSIITLIGQGLYGSAFALVRPSYESYVRAEWLFHCAKDDELQKFVGGRGSPKLDRMLAALEKVSGFDERVLTMVKRNHWKTMSEYAHSGALQVQRRQTDSAVESNYSKEEIKEITDVAEIFGSVAAIALLGMADDVGSAEEIFDTFKARAHDA